MRPPLTATVATPTPTLCATTTDVCFAPAEVGVNCTMKVHDCAGSITALPQPDARKSKTSPPNVEIFRMATFPVPTFLTTTVCGALRCPTATAPNVSVCGVMLISAPADASDICT